MPEARTTTPAGITYRYHVGTLAECGDSYCPEPHASKDDLLDFGEGMDRDPSSPSLYPFPTRDHRGATRSVRLGKDRR